MSDTNRLGLRKLWFQIHKWIGLLLAILIIPLSLSGSALVWHDWLDETVNPARYAVSGVEAGLPPSAYAGAALAAIEPGSLVSNIRYPDDGGPLMVATVARADADRPGPPVRSTVWIDPPTGRVLDTAGSGEGLVRVLHNLHGNLLVPGVGRQIVGWLGVAMLLSCLTGLWLWWPAMGRWTRGLRWRRQNNVDANLHHQMGFWIVIPLAMLSFTGMWISFPQFFAGLAGPAAEQARGGDDRARRIRARPLAETRMTADAALAAAGTGKPASISWPTDIAPAWRVSLVQPKGPALDAKVDDATGEVSRGGGAGGGDRGVARLMRRLHDGTGMGPVWQTIIFIGGILPAALAVTGVIMWWRARGWRGAVARRRQGREAAAEAA